MIRALAAVSVALTAYLLTEHPLAFIAVVVCVVVLAVVGLRPDVEELAEFRHPGGDL